MVFLHAPALLKPELYRLFIVLSVIARILIALTEFIFAVAFYLGFRSMAFAVLQSRP